MATGVLTANALDPNHLVSLCSLTLQPWVSPATLCLSRLAHPHHRLTAACPRRTSRRSPRRAPTCSLPAPPSSTVRPARRAPRPAPGRPPTPARAQHQPPPPRARARDCRLRVVVGLAPPWLTVVPPLSAADDYKATIDGMREELAKVPFPGKAKVAA